MQKAEIRENRGRRCEAGVRVFLGFDEKPGMVEGTGRQADL